MYRLAEKISDMESENQVLRQQTLLNSPVKMAADNLSTPLSKVNISLQRSYLLSSPLCVREFTICFPPFFGKQVLENGHNAVGENRTIVIFFTPFFMMLSV